MSKKIQTLLNAFVGDGARAAKYLVTIDRLPGTAPMSEVGLSVLCKSASFPGKTLTTIPFEYKGRTIQVPSHVKYNQTFELSFYLEESHEARITFMDWIQGFDKSYESYYPGSQTGGKRTNTDVMNVGSAFTESIRALSNDYQKMVPIRIAQLNFDLTEKVTEYVYHNCYPTTISDITVDDSQVGALLEYTVTFTYSHALVYNPKDKTYPFAVSAAAQ